jgi:hypothetical protein
MGKASSAEGFRAAPSSFPAGDGGQHRVQGPVHALDDPPEVALVPGGVGPGRQLPRHRRLGQQVGVGDQRVDRLDAGVEVPLQEVEVAAVLALDLPGDGPLGDVVDAAGVPGPVPPNRAKGAVDKAPG